MWLQSRLFCNPRAEKSLKKFMWSLNLWKPIWHRLLSLTSLSPMTTFSSSYTRFSEGLSTFTPLASFTETWSREIYWWIVIAILKYAISGWHELTFPFSKPPLPLWPTTLPHDGTEPQRLSCRGNVTQQPLTFGLLVVFWPNSSQESLSSLQLLRKSKFSWLLTWLETPKTTWLNRLLFQKTKSLSKNFLGEKPKILTQSSKEPIQTQLTLSKGCWPSIRLKE